MNEGDRARLLIVAKLNPLEGLRDQLRARPPEEGMIPCPLTTFIMSYALARGMLAAGLTVTAALNR
jgi:hypothetical protein